MEKKWLTTFLVSVGIFVVVIGIFLWLEGYFKNFSWEDTFLGKRFSSFDAQASSEVGSERALVSASKGGDSETSESIAFQATKTKELSVSSSSEETLIQEITTLLEVGQDEEVLQRASSYLAHYPQGKYRLPVIQSIATIFYRRKNFSEALNWCRKALTEDIPREYELALASLVGFILKDAEKIDPALLSWMEQVYLRHTAENISGLVVGIAYQYLYKNDPKTALAYLQEAKGELAIIGRARAYLAMQNYPSAIQEYENFFSFYPESNRKDGVKIAFLRQTLYYARINETKNPYISLVYYEKLFRFPESLEAEEGFLGSVRLLRREKRYKEAFSLAKKGLENSQKGRDPDILFEMAACYYESGQKEIALRTYEEFVQRYPNHRLSSQAKEWLELISKEISL